MYTDPIKWREFVREYNASLIQSSLNVMAHQHFLCTTKVSPPSPPRLVVAVAVVGRKPPGGSLGFPGGSPAPSHILTMGTTSQSSAKTKKEVELKTAMNVELIIDDAPMPISTSHHAMKMLAMLCSHFLDADKTLSLEYKSQYNTEFSVSLAV